MKSALSNLNKRGSTHCRTSEFDPVWVDIRLVKAVSDNNLMSVQGYKNPIKYHSDPQVQ